MTRQSVAGQGNRKASAVMLPAIGYLALLLSPCAAYYVPGTFPREFSDGDPLAVEVNSLSSFDTELPYEYYSMPFCKPQDGVKAIKTSANLGSILSGLRLYNSPYEFSMHTVEISKKVCVDSSAGPLSGAEVTNLRSKIRNHYRIRMVLDNIPVTNYDLSKGPSHIRPGFELGYMAHNGKSQDAYIFNHLVFNVLIHASHGLYSARRDTAAELTELEVTGRRMLSWPQGTPAQIVDALKARSARTLSDAKKEDVEEKQEKMAEQTAKPSQKTASEEPAGDKVVEKWMVVGFEVMPCSLKRVKGEPLKHIRCKPVNMDPNPPPAQIIEKGEDIVYTYDVYFDKSDITWASRWDAYLHMPGDGRVHWFSIMNSVLVVMVMSIICAIIMMRTVRRDLAKYEEYLVEGSEGKDESGWKFVSGDVFRCPSNPSTLAVHYGSGVQIFCAGAITMGVAVIGFLSPSTRGALLTTAVVLYVLLAFLAGYSSVFLWLQVTGSTAGWIAVCSKTAISFPGITFMVLTVMNVLISATGTHGSIPFTMYFSVVAFWFVVSIPLTFAGGFAATRATAIKYPCRTNQIPRQVPTPPLSSHPYMLYVAAGILPFCTVFIELYFAMTSMWQGYFYYLFGFLSIVALLTCIITVEVAVLCTYVQLCAGDYNWWWQSFHRGGSISGYLLVYAFIFLFNTLTSMHGLSIMLYLAYMSVVILAIHLSMGALGFTASAYFVYSIFAAFKGD